MTTRELLLGEWRLDPIVIAVAAPTLARHAIAWRFRFSVRSLATLAAVAIFVLALASPLQALARGYLFCAHMAQHLLLLLVVPPLVLIGAPPSASQTSTTMRRRLHFGVGWMLGLGAMWIWHAPALCNAAGRSGAVQTVQVASLLIAGTLFWRPIVGPPEQRLPPLAGVVYLFSACVGCTILGITVTFSPVIVCAVYASPADHLGILPLIREQWGLTPPIDQQIGGLLMWVPACALYLGAILALLARAFRAPGATSFPEEV